MRILTAKELLLVLPTALILGLGIAALQSGNFWIGSAGISALMLVGLLALVAAWRWAGGGTTLAWMTALALFIRLAAGIAVYVALPINGHDELDDKAGFVFTDAHRRDDQAWELASSGKPISAAFDRTYYTDQYGGLLALSALSYRVFSPDAHRPLLILALAALAAALGVPFFFAAARLLWDGPLAALSSWLYVLYPESVLTGGAQMREPFLLALIAGSFWGFANWLQSGQRRNLIWIGVGVLGLLLVSPAIALTTLVVFAVWLRVRGGSLHVSWPIVIAAGGVFIAALLFLAWSLDSHGQLAGGSAIGIILNWFRESVSWVIYQLERGSGQVQNVFSRLNPTTRFLFVVGYGIAQPVLPPAFLAPTTLTWRIIAIFRAMGWYLLLPMLLYAPVAIRRVSSGGERRVWVWLWAACWSWIVICSVRAGGDQWDNPRYRLIFFGFQALVAAFAWLSWLNHRDAWLPRVLGAEIICLLLFGEWYLARYYLIGIHLPILVVLALSITCVVLILLSGIAWDRWRART
jgi:hypothetical protein